MDCCSRGTFECDDAWDQKAHAGLVLQARDQQLGNMWQPLSLETLAAECVEPVNATMFQWESRDQVSPGGEAGGSRLWLSECEGTNFRPVGGGS